MGAEMGKPQSKLKAEEVKRLSRQTYCKWNIINY